GPVIPITDSSPALSCNRMEQNEPSAASRTTSTVATSGLRSPSKSAMANRGENRLASPEVTCAAASRYPPSAIANRQRQSRLRLTRATLAILSLVQNVRLISNLLYRKRCRPLLGDY